MPKDGHDKFKQAFYSDTLVLGRLLEILQSEYDGMSNFEETDAQFDNPNWQYKIAFKNGERARLRKIMSLLDLKE